MKTCFVALIKLSTILLAWFSTQVYSANNEIQIGIPFVPKDTLQQHARLLFGGRINSQSIFIISKPEHYTQGIKSGEFDAFFAKANIGAWAIKNHNYEAVAKLRDPVFLRLITQNDQLDIFEFNDLGYRAICTENTPDLTFHFLQTLFEKPEDLSEKFIFFPEKKIETLLNRNCIGFVVNESRLKLVPEKNNYVTLARSQQFSQIGFFMKKGLNRDIRKQLITKLFSNQSKAFINDLKTFFSVSTDELISADNSDYSPTWAELTPSKWHQP